MTDLHDTTLCQPFANMLLCLGRRVEQLQQRVRHGLEDIGPAVKYSRLELLQVVEIGEYDGVVR